MKKLDILGLPIDEAMTYIKSSLGDINIEIQKTFAWNKESENTLEQARVLKTLEHKDNLTIIIGYF